MGYLDLGRLEFVGPDDTACRAFSPNHRAKIRRHFVRYAQPDGFGQSVVFAGGLILGVWGIRSMLVPGSIGYATVVDMALGLVITFLLTTLSVRMLLYLCERNGIRLGRRPPDAPAPPWED